MMRREYLMYGAIVVLFGGVALWATEAPWQAVALSAVAAALLLLAGAVSVRPAPALILVGERSGERLEPLHRALGQAGYDVEVCPGPENSPCPAAHGRPCPAHGRPVAALVIRHPGQTDPLPPCGRALQIAELAVEEGSDRPPELEDGYGRIGIERGTTEVLGTLDRLLAPG